MHMYYISTSYGKMFLLFVISLVIVFVCAVLTSSRKDKDLSFCSLVFVFFTAIILAAALNEGFALLHPHHVQFVETICYFDPFSSCHYWPRDDNFCTPEGDRITREEADQLYYDTHDFVRDFEGNILEVYPKGEAPESIYTARSEDCPYYLFNMDEEQQDAYCTACMIVENNHISKSAVYERLTDEYSENYPADVASFAIEAMEENQRVDWCAECEDTLLGYTCFRSDLTRREVYDMLIEDGFTKEEAEKAINDCSDQFQ